MLPTPPPAQHFAAPTPPPPPPPPKSAASPYTYTVTSPPPPPPPPPPDPNALAAYGELHGHQAQNYTEQQDGRMGSSQAPQLQAAGGVYMPPLSEGWVPQVLLDKSKSELQALLNDPALLAALLHAPSTAPPALQDPPAPNTPLAALQSLLSTNTGLANHITSREAQLRQRRDEVSARLLAVRGLETQYRRKITSVEEAVAPWAPRALYQNLSGAIAIGEAEARSVEDGFLEATDDVSALASERELVDWLKRVREKRRLVALRRERRARWDEGRVGGWR